MYICIAVTQLYTISVIITNAIVYNLISVTRTNNR